MSKPLAEILHFEALAGIVRDPAGGVPERALPPAFLNLTRGYPARQLIWTILASTRQTPKQVAPGAPSVRRALVGVGTGSATIPRFAEHIMIDGDDLINLRQFDNPMLQAQGEEYVNHEATEFGRRFRNGRVSMVFSILRHGAVFFKADGDGAYTLLPTPTGADITIDMQVPAANKGDLGGLLTDWSLATTPIIDEIQAVVEESIKRSGKQVTHLFYGPNIRNFLLTNNQVKEILKADRDLAASMKQGAIPDGFGDLELKWHPAQRGFFEDNTGTNQDWFTGDELTFTPDPDREWYEIAEGSEFIPSRAFGMLKDSAQQAASGLRRMRGRAMYAIETEDPTGIKLVGFDNVVPVIKVPTAIFLGDATN